VVRGGAAAKAEHGRRAALGAIGLAAAIGAPLVRIFPGCGDHARWLRWSGSEVSWDDNVAELVDAVVPLAEEAERAGVRLCLEPHVKQVAYDARSTLACLAGLRDRGASLSLCFDPANVAAIGHDPVGFLDAVGEVPVCVHVKDVERSTSALPPPGPGWAPYGPHPAIRFRVAGWGELGWRAVLTRLVEIGYDGPLMIEHEDVLCGPARGIGQARRVLEDLLIDPGPGTSWW
jgi:sugar phosphate isomerase/epimerase